MMRKRLKSAGLIGIGILLGVLLSVNLSAVAQRAPDSRPPIPYEDLQLLATVFGKIKSDYVEPVPDDRLIKAAIAGMVHGLDPHSEFLDAAAFDELQVDTKGKFGGLGIEVGIEGGVIRVVAPIEGTPAFRAGVRPGDLIVKIDETATRDVSIDRAIEMMRGEPGSQVALTLLRKDVESPLTMTLTREEIRVQSVRARLLEPGYGYVRIGTFQERTGRELAKAIRDLYAQGNLQGLVLDLRSDPGGLLYEAVAVAAAFLPKEALVVYTDGRAPDSHMRLTASREYYAPSGDDYLRNLPAAVKKVPIVVLVDGGTASASEIVAGALQDYKRATVLGTRSFGKGSVQTVVPLGPKAGLKLTTARYYTPAGRSIQATGIEPDVVVDDGRNLPYRVREANLDRHLEAPAARVRSAATASKDREGGDAGGNGEPGADEHAQRGNAPVRFEFGSAEDFQVAQAIKHLKGEPLMPSVEALAARAGRP